MYEAQTCTHCLGRYRNVEVSVYCKADDWRAFIRVADGSVSDFAGEAGEHDQRRSRWVDAYAKSPRSALARAMERAHAAGFRVATLAAAVELIQEDMMRVENEDAADRPRRSSS
jgi:hypothetical protein